MSLPHRLIIDGVEQCASDDKKEFLRMAYLYLGDLEKEDAREAALDRLAEMDAELLFKKENE